jgi:hypothetical protein
VDHVQDVAIDHRYHLREGDGRLQLIAVH